MAALLSLVSALLLAVGTTLQHGAARSESTVTASAPRRPGKIALRIIRNPTWIAGSVIDLGAYGFEIAALSAGRLTVVQPLLALGLVFALPMSARRSRSAQGLRTWLAALTVASSITVFVLMIHPVTSSAATPGRWPIVVGGVGLLIGTALVAVRSRPAAARATGLAFAAGLTYGLTAALTKAVVDSAHDGWWHAASSWTFPCLGVASLAGLLLGQAAFRAGPLSSSLPTLTVTQRIIGTGLGLVLFGERFPLHTGQLIAALAAGTFAIIGIATLLGTANSPSPIGSPPSRRGERIKA